MEIKTIEFADQDGSPHTLDCSEKSHSGKYENLSQDEKDNIEHVLFLMDKFCMGDEIYHELSMFTEGLPKSYLIKQKRARLNATYHIERTPGIYPELSLNFTSTLGGHVRELSMTTPALKERKIQVKLSGDGARISKNNKLHDDVFYPTTT